MTVVATDTAGWAAINDLAADFADGVVREVALVAGEHVDPSGVLSYGSYPRLIVHTQMQGLGGTSVRLEFAGVRGFSYDHTRETSPALATDVELGVWEVELLGLRVTAEECVARKTGAAGLGEGPFLISP